MVKISDVAREAGVSVATVSRTLNQQPGVNPEFAQRVRAAAERLGYRPNVIARSLRRQSTTLIALIISDVGNPFFTAVTRGVEDVARQNGYSVLLCNADEDAGKEATYLAVAEEHQVAGVVLSPHAGDTDISRLEAAGIPVVVIDRPLHNTVDTVLVNSFDGARSATEHLLDEGWLRPACVTGPRDAETAEQRLSGYLKAIEDDGGAPPLFRHGPFRQGGGRQAAAELLDAPEPPDAIFVANSQMALGVLDELNRRELEVGVDIGIIVFDDAPWAPFVKSPLSVVAQPAYDIGAQATQLLGERVSSDGSFPPRSITLSTQLIVRDSSRRRRA